MSSKIEFEFDEQVKAFREHNISFIQEVFRSLGSVAPFCIMLTFHAGTGFRIGYIPIDPIFISTDQYKDILAKQVIPAIRTACKKEGHIPIAICYGSEAWLRKWDHAHGKIPDNYKEILPAKGVLQLTIETEFKCEFYSWEIEGDNPDVEAPDLEIRKHAKLTLLDTEEIIVTAGRFHNLFGNKNTN